MWLFCLMIRSYSQTKLKESYTHSNLKVAIIWLKSFQTYLLQRVLTEIITAALKNEKVAMVIILNLGMCPLITEKICKDLVKVTEKDRWSKLVQCIPQLFPLLCIGKCISWCTLSLLPQNTLNRSLCWPISTEIFFWGNIDFSHRTQYQSYLSFHYLAGHLILPDGAISHNWSQIASGRTIWGKSHNSLKKC